MEKPKAAAKKTAKTKPDKSDPTAAKPGKRGRPSKYTPELAKTICDRIAGGESLRAVCSEPGMPHLNTVNLWMNDNREFMGQYARAREAQADRCFERMEEIERDTLSGALEAKAANAVLSNMRWRMGKMAPKKYSDRLQVEHQLSLEALVVGSGE